MQPLNSNQPISIFITRLHSDHWTSIIAVLPKLELWKLAVLCKEFSTRITAVHKYKEIQTYLKQYRRQKDKEFNRNFAIYRAISNQDVEMLTYFNPNTTLEYTLATRACARHGMVRELRKFSKLAGKRNIHWNDILSIAARHGHMAICRIAIGYGATDWITAGYRAAAHGSLEIYQLLFDNEMRNSRGKPFKFVNLSMHEICKYGNWHLYEWLRTTLKIKQLQHLFCCLVANAPLTKVKEEQIWYDLRGDFLIDWQSLLFASATNPDLEVLKYVEKHLKKPRWDKPFLNAILHRQVTNTWYMGMKEMRDETREMGIKLAQQHGFTEIVDLFEPVKEKNESTSDSHTPSHGTVL